MFLNFFPRVYKRRTLSLVFDSGQAGWSPNKTIITKIVSFTAFACQILLSTVIGFFLDFISLFLFQASYCLRNGLCYAVGESEGCQICSSTGSSDAHWDNGPGTYICFSYSILSYNHLYS